MAYKLKEIRQSKELTQTQLAKASRVSRATINKIENGTEVEVKIGTLAALAKALDCNITDFLCS